MSGSVSFDRAADYYDNTRAIPDEVLSRLMALLASELPRGEMCLEIGIGTGRIALPLVASGMQVVGVDISREMLRKLIAKKSAAWPQVAIADATRLPFADNAFGSAIASHVLHLIPDWPAAVAELARVVRSRGVIVASRGNRGENGLVQLVRRRFFEEAGAPPWPPGVDRLEELDEHMLRQGATVRALSLPPMRSSSSLNRLIAGLEAGYWSACWSIDPDARREAAARTRAWAARELGDLDVERDAAQSSAWHVYKLGK